MPKFLNVEGKLEDNIADPGGEPCLDFSFQGKIIAPNTSPTYLKLKKCLHFEMEGKLEEKIPAQG